MPGKSFTPARQSFHGDIVSAESLEGGLVVDPQGAELGLVLELLLDLDRGAIAYAIVAQAERVIAMPWDELRARHVALVPAGLPPANGDA
jgi:sporulation protein YlmC with PRC-barrel domain